MFQKGVAPGSPSAESGERLRERHGASLGIFSRPGPLQVGRREGAPVTRPPTPSMSSHSCCSAVTSLGTNKLFSCPPSSLFRSISKGNPGPKSSLNQTRAPRSSGGALPPPLSLPVPLHPLLLLIPCPLPHAPSPLSVPSPQAPLHTLSTGLTSLGSRTQAPPVRSCVCRF